MSYIGTPPSNAFTSLLKQDFTTSVTTGYTLDHAVNNANDIALFINFVRQEPTAAYSASGVTLTLTSATSATDDMYCVYLGQALQTVNPPNASVGASQIVDSSIALGKLSATGTKDATTFLRGDNTFQTIGANTPAYCVYLSSLTALTSAVTTKIAFNTEILDTNSDYDNSTNYRFQPQSAGKYFITSTLSPDCGAVSVFEAGRVFIYKNGSAITGAATYSDFRNNQIVGAPVTASTIVDMNGSSDYIEIYGYVRVTSSTANISSESHVLGYKILT